MKKIVLALCIVLTVFTGCQKDEELQRKSYGEHLVIGLIPEHNLFRQLDRYEPLANYLSGKLQMEVTLKILPRYGNIIDNFISTGLDGAFFGSFTYALAHTRLGVEVLARPESTEGRSTYYGMILVREDSGILNARDMKGKRFAFVDKATTAGYLLPLAYFREQGIDNYKAYLGETYFAGTHEDVIYDVLRGRADIGAAKNTVFDRLSAENKAIADNLRILKVSPEVPENGLAVRKDLDPSLKKNIKAILLNMNEDPEGQVVLEKLGFRKFIETSDEDYEPVFDYARKAGVDMNSYDYINE